MTHDDNDHPMHRFASEPVKKESDINPTEMLHQFLTGHCAMPDHEHMEFTMTMGQWRHLFRRIT